MKTIRSIPNDKRYSGCTVLERGTGYVSNEIARHNKMMAVAIGEQYVDFTHSEKLYWDEDDQQLYTFGARISGTEKSKVQDYYVHGNNILIRMPNEPLNDDDNKRLKAFFQKTDKHKYQFIALITWIHDIKFLGTLPKAFFKSKKRNYCYKLTAKADEVIFRWPAGKQTDKVTIFDHVKNPYYHTFNIFAK